MKLLVVSDIHANWPALQAIQEPADAIVCLEDVVSYGPFPQECVAWVRERAAYVIRGNHDTALSYQTDPRVAPAKQALALATLEAHRRLLSEADVRWLHDLGTAAHFHFDGCRYTIVHAAPSDHLFNYRITPALGEEALKKEMAGVRADLVLLGHTHLPMQRAVNGTVVLNPGSVGQSLDGDPRASYAIIQDGVATIRRVEYDIEATTAGIRRMGVPDEMADVLIGILKTGRP